jgi:hypothetical protein
MGIRSLKSASIAGGTKRSKFWDQSTVINNNSYESIATVAVSNAITNTITFSSIPQTYKHLQLRAIYRGTGDPGINMYINGDSNHANYYAHSLYGDGANAAANAPASNPYIVYYPDATKTTNVFGAFVMDILDYTNTNKYRVSRNIWGYDANGTGNIALQSQLYKSTTAVTSIVLQNEYSLNLAQYSHFALYGIKG